MTDRVTRRQLFARLRGGPAQLRPPWLIDEDAFLDRCTRCGDCATHCPTKVIASGHGGYPIVDFTRAGCTFCGACAQACSQDCFAPTARSAATRARVTPWQLGAVIGAQCVETKGVSCRMCEERCEVSAIRFRPTIGGGSAPTVTADDCTGCGACVAACPVNAITIQQLPARPPAPASALAEAIP